MVNVRVFKAADDLHDGVHLADVGEKLVAQAFACAGALHEAGDVHKLHRRRNGDLRLGDVLQHFQARVGHGDDADVGVDRAERVVGRFRLAGAGHSVEQGGLAHVGQTDDSGFEHK